MAASNSSELPESYGILSAVSIACFGWRAQQTFMVLSFLENKLKVQTFVVFLIFNMLSSVGLLAANPSFGL